MEVKVINKSGNPLPGYETAHAAGMDLRAFLEAAITMSPMQRVLIPTGLFMELPVGFEAQVRPRSGLAMRDGITVLNSPGTIDADYRGEVKVLLINLGAKEVVINNGDRIAQMVIARHETAAWKPSDSLGETARGEGGYGSTGK